MKLKYFPSFVVLFLNLLTSIKCVIGNSPVIKFYRKDYKYLQEIDGFYKEHSILQNWSDALATCKSEGAELFLPSSQNELNTIINLLTFNSYWLPLHDIYSEGYFITDNGKPASTIFMNWKPGEPNNVEDSENCVAMMKDGFYFDFNCNKKLNFICKKSEDNITQNSICETYDLEYAYAIETDECYKLHKKPNTWQEAFKICVGEESSLVIINSQAEAQLLTNIFNQYPEGTIRGNFDKRSIFVGFNDLIDHGNYLTIDGKSLEDAGYSNWFPNQPDYGNNNGQCGVMYRDTTIGAMDCSTRAMFICEKHLSNPKKSDTNYRSSVQ